MIEIRSDGSIFSCGADCLVNPVNCAGTMGKGLAFAFRKQFPDMFRHYARDCAARRIRVGSVSFWTNPDPNARVKTVVNFPTKNHWRDDSQFEWIESGLKDLAVQLPAFGVKKLAVPALGCGNGGLDFEDVLPLIQENLSTVTIPILVFAPQ